MITQKNTQVQRQREGREAAGPLAVIVAPQAAKRVETGGGATSGWPSSGQRGGHVLPATPLDARGLKGSPHANIANQKMKQMQHYRERMEQQRQNLSLLRVEGSKTVYGKQDQGRPATQPPNTSKRRAQHRVTAPGQTQTSPDAATATVRRDMEGSGVEDDFSKNGIRVTIESPNVGSLAGGNRGDSSAPTFTEIASQGYLQGPGSRQGSSYLPASKEQANEAVLEAQGEHIDFGVLSPATLAEAGSQALAARRSREGAAAALSDFLGLPEHEQAGLAAALARREPVQLVAHGATEPTSEAVLARPPYAGSSQHNEYTSAKAVNHDLYLKSIETSYLPRSKNREPPREGSHAPQGAPGLGKPKPQQAARLKADSMLSKIVEVQAPRPQPPRKHGKKRELGSRDEQLSGQLPPTDVLGHQQLSKRQLRQLHEQQVLLRMQKQQMSNVNANTAVMVGGSDYSPLDLEDAEAGRLVSQMARVSLLDRVLPASHHGSSGEESGSRMHSSSLGYHPPNFPINQIDMIQQEGQRLATSKTGQDRGTSNQVGGLISREASAGRTSLVEKFALGSAGTAKGAPFARPTRHKSVGGVGLPVRNHPSANLSKNRQQSQDLAQSVQVVDENRLQPDGSAGGADAQPAEQVRMTIEATQGPASAAGPAQFNIEIEPIQLQRGDELHSSQDYGTTAAQRSGKSRASDFLMVQGRANRAGSSTSDYNLRDTEAHSLHKPQTADQPTRRLMQSRVRNHNQGGLDRLSDARGSMQYQNFQRQLIQIRSNKMWSNQNGKTLLAHQQKRTTQMTPGLSSTATTCFGSLSMGNAVPGTAIGKSRQGIQARTNPQEERRPSVLREKATLDVEAARTRKNEKQAERLSTSANTTGFVNCLQSAEESYFQYHHSVQVQPTKNSITAEDCQSILTEERGLRPRFDPLDLPAEQVFGVAFKDSFSFLEQFDVKDIKQRIYARDGSLRDDAKPFFMEQQEKEKMVRVNRTHKLRANDQTSRLHANCRPLSGNYIHSRMKTNQRHYEKCKGRLMTYFAHQLVYQKRASNSQMARRETRRPAPLLKQAQSSIGTAHGQHGRASSLQGRDTTPEPGDQRPLPTSTKRTAGAGASSEGDVGGSEESRRPGAAVMASSSIKPAVRAQLAMQQAELYQGRARAMADGNKVLATGVSVDVAAARQEGAQSSLDPNSAMPNSANVKIVQRMYSDTGDSPKPKDEPCEGSQASIELNEGEPADGKDSQRARTSQRSKNLQGQRHLQDQKAQNRQTPHEAEAQAAPVSADFVAEMGAQRTEQSPAVDAQRSQRRTQAENRGQEALDGGKRQSRQLQATSQPSSEAGPHLGVAGKNISSKHGSLPRNAASHGANVDLSGHQWMYSQNRIFEDFILQTNNAKQQYLPIQSKVQKLNGNNVGLNLDSMGLKTPAEIMLFNNQLQHRVAMQARAQDGGAVETAQLQRFAASAAQDNPQLASSGQTVAQSEEIAAQERSKPLWIVQKATQSNVVNYRSDAGHNLTKLSVGDPYKQYRMIEEHERRRQQLPTRNLAEQGPEARGSAGAAADRMKSSNSDINDVVAGKETRLYPGNPRSFAHPGASGVPPHNRGSSQTKGNRKPALGPDAVKVGVNPRYLQSQREAVRHLAMSRADRTTFDNFNLNKNPQAIPDGEKCFSFQESVPRDSARRNSQPLVAEQHRLKDLRANPKIPTAHQAELRTNGGQSVGQASRRIAAGHDGAQAIVATDLEAKATWNGPQRSASVDGGEESLCALAPQAALLQHRGEEHCESSLLGHPPSQQAVECGLDSPGPPGHQHPLDRMTLANAYQTHERMLSEQAAESQRSREPNFKDSASVGGGNTISRRTHGGTVGSNDEGRAQRTQRKLSPTTRMPMESRREVGNLDLCESTPSPLQGPNPGCAADARFVVMEQARSQAVQQYQNEAVAPEEPIQLLRKVPKDRLEESAPSDVNQGLRRLTAHFSALDREHEQQERLPPEPRRALDGQTAACLGQETISDHPDARRNINVSSNAAPKNLESKPSNSKIVYQTKKGDISQGRSRANMEAEPAVEGQVADAQRDSIKNSTFMSDEDRQRREHDSSIVGQAGRPLEPQLSERVGFEHRSYGVGNVATYRDDELNQSTNQEQLAKALAPYVTTPADDKMRRRGSAATPASQAVGPQPNGGPPEKSFGVVARDGIGSFDLQVPRRQNKDHHLQAQGIAAAPRSAVDVSAADLMDDPRYTNSGLTIQRITLAPSRGPQKPAYQPKKKRRNKSLGKSKRTNVIPSQFSPESPRGAVERGIVELGQPQPEEAGGSFSVSPERGEVQMDAKNIAESSPDAPTSGGRTQDAKLFQSKSQISGTIVNDSPLADQLLGNVAERNARFSPSAAPTQEAEPKLMCSSPLSEQEDQGAKQTPQASEAVDMKVDFKSATRSESPVELYDSAISSRVINELIPVEASHNDRPTLDQRIARQAKEALARKLREPLHEALPKYLQRQDMGTKFQFQVPKYKRRSSLIDRLQGEKEPGSEMLCGFGPKTDGNLDPEAARMEPDICSERLHDAARRAAAAVPASRVVNDRLTSHIDEQSKLGNVNVNIKNLYQHTKRARTQAVEGSMLKPIGLVDEEQVLMREIVPELLLVRHEKSEHFYQQQLDHVGCARGKKLVDKEIDPSVRLDRSRLSQARKDHLESVCSERLSKAKGHSQDGAVARKANQATRVEGKADKQSEVPRKSTGFTAKYDKGGRAGRVAVTQTRLGRSNPKPAASVPPQKPESRPGRPRPKVKRRVDTAQRRGSQPEDGERAFVDRSRTRSIETNRSDAPPNHVGTALLTTNEPGAPGRDGLGDAGHARPRAGALEAAGEAAEAHGHPDASRRRKEPASRKVLGNVARHTRAGTLEVACHGHGDAEALNDGRPATQPLISPPGVVDVKRRGRAARNADLMQMRDSRPTTSDKVEGIVDQTLHMTLADSTIEDPKKSEAGSRDGSLLNKRDFKRGVHRDFRGLVVQQHRRQATGQAGAVGSLSPQSRTVRQLQGNRILGKYKQGTKEGRRIQRAGREKMIATAGTTGDDKMGGSSLAAPGWTPTSVPRATTGGSQSSHLPLFERGVDGVPALAAYPEASAAEATPLAAGSAKHESIGDSRRSAGLLVHDQYSRVTNGRPDAQGYSSLGEDYESRVSMSRARARRASMDDHLRSSAPLESQQSLTQLPGSMPSSLRDRGTFDAGQTILDQRAGGARGGTALDARAPKKPEPRQDMAQAHTQARRASHPRAEPSSDVATSGQIGERRLRELLGNRDLFSLPTTEVEDLLREMREQAGPVVRDFGLLGYRAAIQPIDEVLMRSRSQGRSLMDPRYGQKKPIQPFFKENRAEQRIKVRERCEALEQSRLPCPRAPRLIPASPRQASTGMSGPEEPIAYHEEAHNVEPQPEAAAALAPGGLPDPMAQADIGTTTNFSHASSPASLDKTRSFTQP